MAQKTSILLPTLLTLLGIATLCSLGSWQLHRLEWKTERIAQLDAEYKKDAAQIPLAPADLDGDFHYRRGTVRGAYVFDRQILLGPRVYRNLPGRHVYTPLRLEDGSFLLVNRGWVPGDWTFETETPAEHAAAQSKKITGLLRKPAKRNAFTPDNRPAKDEWYFADIPAISAEKDIPGLHDTILELEDGDAGNRYPVAQATKPDIPNDHLQYAIFWFSMAGILAVIYALRFLKKEKQHV